MSLRTRRGVSRSTSLAAALAAVSVLVAVWLSLQPHRLGDLHRVAGWTSQWLHGVSLYGPDSDVDYPPWAIVTLSPIALIPSGWLPMVWGSINLVALGFIARRLSRSWGTLFFLLIAAGAMRTLNQFSLVALALAVAGTTGATPTSALWLGLSLMKPQIGAVFWLHALWRREWRLASLALAVPALLMVIYAARVHVPLLGVPGAYAQSIHVQYDDIFWGQTEITSWLRTLAPGGSAIAIALLVAGAAFAPLARVRPLLGLALASLLAMRHLSYDLILLLPWVATRSGTALWLSACVLVADPSAVAGLLAPDSFLAQHGDRLLLSLFWGLSALQAFRVRRSAGIAPAPAE